MDSTPLQQTTPVCRNRQTGVVYFLSSIFTALANVLSRVLLIQINESSLNPVPPVDSILRYSISTSKAYILTKIAV